MKAWIVLNVFSQKCWEDIRIDPKEAQELKKCDFWKKN